MSLYDNEHPQHLAHLARAKAASRRTTEMLDAADRAWRPPETAPRDGSKFTVLYDDGSTEDEVYWSNERYCMLGAPQGSCGPGFVSTEAGNLPVGDCPDITHWRAAQHDGGGAGITCTGIAEAKAAAAIDRENRRVPWAVRVRAA